MWLPTIRWASFAFCKRRTSLHCFGTLPPPGDALSPFSGGKGWCSAYRPGEGSLVLLTAIVAMTGEVLQAVFEGCYTPGQLSFVRRAHATSHPIGCSRIYDCNVRRSSSSCSEPSSFTIRRHNSAQPIVCHTFDSRRKRWRTSFAPSRRTDWIGLSS